MLHTTPAATTDDVRLFFDRFATENFERHGSADRLLRYRTRILSRYGRFHEDDILLDLGCGNGNHMFALDGRFARGIGIDLSAGMISSARLNIPHDARSDFRFIRDDAQHLLSLPNQSVDIAICVGALEHMPDKLAVLRSVRRVLRDGGRFVCLTLNDQFLWYRVLAPALGFATRHLTTDWRLDTEQALSLLPRAGFDRFGVAYWSFVPSGDMPATMAFVCRALEGLGRILSPRNLRGGLVLYAEK